MSRTCQSLPGWSGWPRSSGVRSLRRFTTGDKQPVRCWPRLTAAGIRDIVTPSSRGSLGNRHPNDRNKKEKKRKETNKSEWKDRSEDSNGRAFEEQVLFSSSVSYGTRGRGEGGNLFANMARSDEPKVPCFAVAARCLSHLEFTPTLDPLRVSDCVSLLAERASLYRCGLCVGCARVCSSARRLISYIFVSGLLFVCSVCSAFIRFCCCP